MSYARFGDDCDVYVYPHAAGGITIHVASHRLVYSPDHPPPEVCELSAVDERVLPAAFARVQRLVRESRQNASREAIGGAYNGETFCALSPEKPRASSPSSRGADTLCPKSWSVTFWMKTSTTWPKTTVTSWIWLRQSRC